MYWGGEREREEGRWEIRMARKMKKKKEKEEIKDFYISIQLKARTSSRRVIVSTQELSASRRAAVVALSARVSRWTSGLTCETVASCVWSVAAWWWPCREWKSRASKGRKHVAQEMISKKKFKKKSTWLWMYLRVEEFLKGLKFRYLLLKCTGLGRCNWCGRRKWELGWSSRETVSACPVLWEERVRSSKLM